MNRMFVRAAVVILAARLIWMYVIPAWNEITTDFQNYYTAAWAVRQHHPLVDLYDTSWFQRESQRAGIQNRTALFNYFTPFSALLMYPVAGLPPLEAKRVWVVLNLAALAAVVLVVAKLLSAPGALVLLIALLGGDALGNNFGFGQFYIVLTLLLMLVVLFLDRRPALAGWCLSLATAAKLFPALFIIHLASLRRWKAAVWALVGVTAFTVLGLAIMGWQPHMTYLQEVMPRTIQGEIQDPYNVRWNTLQALLRRALVLEPGLNPNPIADLPVLYFFLRTFVSVTIVFVTLVALRNRRFGLIEYGAWIAAISLITPSQASYHQFLFFPAVAAAIYLQRDLRVQMILAVVFALICSNYMGATANWDSGLAMLLGFPRVYLVLALWIFFLAPKKQDYIYVPALAALLAIVSASFAYNRWKADDRDGAVMARPEEHGLLEVHPTIGASGLVFSALRPEGYTLLHPSAFGSGLVYESDDGIAGRLPDGTAVRWAGGVEPSLGNRSVVAVSEDGHAALERTADDPDWRELFRRATFIRDPAISPDGQAVMFSEWVNGRYRISRWSRGGEIRPLLEGPADYRYPAWSPDGRKLAFATNEEGNWDIGVYTFEMPAAIVTTSRSNDYMPVFSSDGGQIYFASDRRRGYRFTAIYSIALRP